MDKEKYLKKKEEYLQTIDEVIEKGPYKPTWESLANHEEPEWYKNAKFGMFIHWGIYSVPAYDSEWYSRHMYLPGEKAYEHHLKTYGKHKDFGYKDFIPMFKAEKFDPDAWMDLFQEAGAKYVTPVGEHHDGFQMYKSELSPFNAAEMGPCRDVLGELKAAAEKRGIQICTSSHRVEHYWFMNGGRRYESDLDDPEWADFYGPAMDLPQYRPENPEASWLIEEQGPDEAYLKDWLVRCCEMIDRYQPGFLYFDWWVQNIAVKPYMKKFVAYYYNRAKEWGKQVTVCYKYNALAPTVGTFDVERGQLAQINPRLWQTDTSIAKNSWGYTEGNDFKNSTEIVCDLVDIVSKNGCMMLNVGPKSDGTISDEETKVLKEIGAWLKVNGEGIYGTTFWKIFGEGPTKVVDGAFTDTDRAPFTSDDIRYTYKSGHIYAFIMKAPKDGVAKLPALKRENHDYNGLKVLRAELLGGGELQFERDGNDMTVYLGEIPQTDKPICIKIAID